VTPFKNPPYKIMGTYVMRALLTRRTRTEETVGMETEMHLNKNKCTGP